MKTKKKATNTKTRNKRVASIAKTATAAKRPKTIAKAATGAQAKPARHTAEGKFTKAIFAQIGGAECPRFAAMTWKERDKFLAKPENSLVRECYEAHLALNEA
jgi:hypothetical protein